MKIALLEEEAFQDIPSKLSTGKHNIRFPLVLGFSGSLRLKDVKNILREDPQQLISRFATYELAEELVNSLSLNGIRLGADGECEYLSPRRWVEAPTPLFDSKAILKYFSTEQVTLVELLVPRWALPFQKKVSKTELLPLYEQMLSPVSPYLYFRVEK